MHLLKTVGCWLIVHDIYEVRKKARHRILDSFIAFVVDDVKERWAGYHHSLRFNYIDDGTRCNHNQGWKRLSWEEIHDFARCHARKFLSERYIQSDLYNFTHVYVD